MNPSKDTVRTYVQALTQEDDPVMNWTIYADQKIPKGVARDLRGTLDEVWQQLEKANSELQMGIGVRLSEFNDNGTKQTDVVRVRAILQDNDFGHLPLLSDPMPSAHTRGRAGDHRVLFLDEQDTQKFLCYERYAKALAVRDRTDPAVCLLTQLQRLPGSVNWKDSNAPVIVELLECHPDRRYTYATIAATLQWPSEAVLESYEVWHKAKKLCQTLKCNEVADFGTMAWDAERTTAEKWVAAVAMVRRSEHDCLRVVNQNGLFEPALPVDYYKVVRHFHAAG
jgi:hypothetical protein